MYQPGDVVLIPFPFAARQATKKRPVLVMTAPDQFDDLVPQAPTMRMPFV